MERRIRVKCLECDAAIQLMVDQQELVDVSCPRCQHAFTAVVPPPAPEVVEIIELEEAPPVRQTRVVQPAPRPAPQSRPRRTRTVPQPNSMGAPSASFQSWQNPASYSPAPRISAATHFKAILIAAGGVFAVIALVVMGFMVKSAISNIDWAEMSSSDTNTPLASSSSGTEVNSASPNIFEPSTTNAPTEAASGPTEKEVITQRVLALGRELAQATIDENYELILDRANPRLVSAAGGRATMLANIKKQMQSVKDAGGTIEAYTLADNVTIRQSGRHYFVVIPTTLKFKLKNRTFQMDSADVAFSDDSGKTFSILAGNAVDKNRRALKQFFPIPDDLYIPAVSQPREIQ